MFSVQGCFEILYPFIYLASFSKLLRFAIFAVLSATFIVCPGIFNAHVTPFTFSEHEAQSPVLLCGTHYTVTHTSRVQNH